MDFTKIILPLREYQPSAYIRSLLAVTAMDFDEKGTFLQMVVQRVNSEGVKYRNTVASAEDENSVKDICLIYDLSKKDIVQDMELLKNCIWPDWQMAPAINARQQGTHLHLSNPEDERTLLYKETVYMSKVARFGALDDAICGSQDGTLYLFKFQALTIERLKVMEFKFDKVMKKDMAATRCYSGHTSMISSIEISEDRVVCTTSLSDQCIIQWRVEYEDQHWELDFNAFQPETTDPFVEVPTHHRF